jgi:hypothetical protein
MDSQQAMRAAAEAANHTTIGFWQGLGWALAGIVATVVTAALALVFHHFIILGAVIAAAVALYRWRKRRGQRLGKTNAPAVASTEPIVGSANRTAPTSG